MRGTRFILPALLAACAQGDPSGGADLAPSELTTEGGLYVLRITPSSDPFLAGEEAGMEVEIRAGDDAVVGADLQVDPFMPDMGHGVQDAPVVTEAGQGVYRATWTFSMPGYWEVELTVDAEPGVDRGVAAYEVE